VRRAARELVAPNPACVPIVDAPRGPVHRAHATCVRHKEGSSGEISNLPHLREVVVCRNALARGFV